MMIVKSEKMVLAQITSPRLHHGSATASQLALVARFYGRFGDQAASGAKRLEFATTGAMPP